jgi:hypothetical protein
MGQIGKGILGGIQGTVGTVIGGTWNGISYIRSLPLVSNKPPSQAQVEQREKFRTVIRFLRSLRPIVEAGFKNGAYEMTGYNRAVAHIYEGALTGTYPAFGIAYAMAELTNGALPNVLAPVATAEPNSIVKFDWTNNIEVGKAKATDFVMLIVYCPETNQAVYTMTSHTRGDETGTINARQFAGKVVHTWVGCMNAKKTEAGTSVYTGQLTVS